MCSGDAPELGGDDIGTRSILVQSAAVRAQVQEVVDAVSQLPRERHL